MITTAKEFLELVEKADDASMHRIRFDHAPDCVWIEVIRGNPAVHRAVTLNKFLPVSVMAILAQVSNPEVRTDIANRRALSATLFDLLSRDKDESVRARIAWNKKTPVNILQRLAHDKSPIVADVARNRLSSHLQKIVEACETVRKEEVGIPKNKEHVEA